MEVANIVEKIIYIDRSRNNQHKIHRNSSNKKHVKTIFVVSGTLTCHLKHLKHYD